MTKIKRSDRKLVYISPLKNCENEKAKLIADFVEHFLIDSIEIQLDVIRCRVEQIYKHADAFMRELKK